MKKDTLIHIPEPAASKRFFADTRFSWLWLLARVFVGIAWLSAGWAKVTDPAWFGPHAGEALTGFLRGSLWGVAGSSGNVVSPWYWFFVNNVALPHAPAISVAVAVGELIVGFLLILGAFTGVAAALGIFLNFNYLVAGVVSVDPLFVILEILLVLAWRTAGWLGMDQLLLPTLGVPWQPGKLFKGEKD